MCNKLCSQFNINARSIDLIKITHNNNVYISYTFDLGKERLIGFIEKNGTEYLFNCSKCKNLQEYINSYLEHNCEDGLCDLFSPTYHKDANVLSWSDHVGSDYIVVFNLENDKFTTIDI